MARFLKKNLFLFLGLIVLAGTAEASTVYRVQKTGSEIYFKVDHSGIPLVKGRFEKFDGTLFFEGNRLECFEGTAHMDTLTTGLRARDNDLQSDHFFAAEQFPVMTIRSAWIIQTEDHVDIAGYLTIRDITKLVTLRGTVERGNAQKKEAGLKLEGTIDRRDFGLRLKNFFEFFAGENVVISLKLKAVLI